MLASFEPHRITVIFKFSFQCSMQRIRSLVFVKHYWRLETGIMPSSLQNGCQNIAYWISHLWHVLYASCCIQLWNQCIESRWIKYTFLTNWHIGILWRSLLSDNLCHILLIYLKDLVGLCLSMKSYSEFLSCSQSNNILTILVPLFLFSESFFKLWFYLVHLIVL